MRKHDGNTRLSEHRRWNCGTLLRKLATPGWIIAAALLAIPCMAQLPPGVLYSTILPYSIPSGTTVGADFGPGIPYVSAVATDASGNSYVTGPVYVTGYASTPGVVQPANAGGECYYGENIGGTPDTPCADAFVAKFDSSGKLVFLTYLGGTGSDMPISLAVDATGDIYVGGTTTSTDFPMAGTPYRQAFSNQGTFIAKLSGDGTKLLWSTVLNGFFTQSAIGPDGSVYCFLLPIGGNSAAPILTKLKPNGQFVATVNLPESTQAIAVGTDGSVYIGEDGIVAKMGPNLSGFDWQISFGAATSIVGLLQPAPDGSLWAQEPPPPSPSRSLRVHCNRNHLLGILL
jgi:Beta-propeller repeat